MNDCVITALKNALRAARECRAAQRAYFHDRTDFRLVIARQLESHLDFRIKQADYALLHGCSLPEQTEFPF